MAGASTVRNLSTAMEPNPDGSYHKLAVSSSVVSLESLNVKTRGIKWVLEGANVRVTFDGSDPVAGSHGFLLQDKSTYDWSKALAQAAKFVREGGSDATFHAQEVTW